MPRKARQIDALAPEVLEEAAADFMSCALKAVEGLIPNQRELADRLGWPVTTLSSALKGSLTFSSWPKICRALGRDPIDELLCGRAKLREAEDREREDSYRRMLERTQADTLVAFFRRLPVVERLRVRELMMEASDAAAPRRSST